MKIGIIGSEGAKFTPSQEQVVRAWISLLLEPRDAVLVSGGCHLGGVDIWAEEEADFLGNKKIIHLPRLRRWSGGYRERNLAIARDSDVVHVFVPRQLPEGYTGMRFNGCYHCHGRNPEHVKSGACWTAWQAEAMGKRTEWHVID